MASALLCLVDVFALLLATVVAGLGVELDGPGGRVGGVAEADIALMERAALHLMGRARQFHTAPDSCPEYAAGGLFDGAVGVRFHPRDSIESQHAVPFMEIGGGFEFARFTLTNCSDQPSRSNRAGFLFASIGIDLFAPNQSHIGLRVLLRGDVAQWAGYDGGGALMVIARF